MKVLLLHAFPFDERMWEGYEGVAPRLYGRGGSIDPMDAFRAFRGRDPEIEPLLARRGLTGV